MKQFYYTAEFCLVKGRDSIHVVLNAPQDTFAAFVNARRRYYPSWRMLAD